MYQQTREGKECVFWFLLCVIPARIYGQGVHVCVCVCVCASACVCVLALVLYDCSLSGIISLL